jgi:CRP/FNR family transcriptional regulator, cyclic AMP receptor protein
MKEGAAMWSHHDSWIETYDALPLFAGCSRSELRLVSGVTTRLWLPPGKVLAHQGERPSAFVIVLDGIAEAGRHERHVEEIATGSYFGEISLVRGIGEPATVIAQTDLTVDVVGPREFRALYSLLDGFRERVDHEIDRRIASWLTPRSTVTRDANLTRAW